MRNSGSEAHHFNSARDTDFDIVGGGGLPQDTERLRHLGFRTIVIGNGKEHHSFGPSYFHQLGFCVAGDVTLTAFGDHQPKQLFGLNAGDVFFLPAGSQYIIDNLDAEPSKLIIASARDNFDIAGETEFGFADIPSRPSAGPLLEMKSQAMRRNATSRRPSITWDVVDQSPHVVLFFETPGAHSIDNETISGLFSRDIVAREFGISKDDLPALDFVLHDPLVIRPIADEHLF